MGSVKSRVVSALVRWMQTIIHDTKYLIPCELWKYMKVGVLSLSINGRTTASPSRLQDVDLTSLYGLSG